MFLVLTGWRVIPSHHYSTSCAVILRTQIIMAPHRLDVEAVVAVPPDLDFL